MKVYRLITRNSYEREMFDKASLKLGLDKAVLQSMSGREGNIAGVRHLPRETGREDLGDEVFRGKWGMKTMRMRSSEGKRA